MVFNIFDQLAALEICHLIYLENPLLKAIYDNLQMLKKMSDTNRKVRPMIEPVEWS